MILVFGSINVDLIVPVPHLPEPGETVLGGDYAFLPGGKGGNQALAARRAGAAVMLAGAVGMESFADIALGLCAARVSIPGWCGSLRSRRAVPRSWCRARERT